MWMVIQTTESQGLWLWALDYLFLGIGLTAASFTAYDYGRLSRTWAHLVRCIIWFGTLNVAWVGARLTLWFAVCSGRVHRHPLHHRVSLVVFAFDEVCTALVDCCRDGTFVTMLGLTASLVWRMHVQRSYSRLLTVAGILEGVSGFVLLPLWYAVGYLALARKPLSSCICVSVWIGEIGSWGLECRWQRPSTTWTCRRNRNHKPQGRAAWFETFNATPTAYLLV